MNKEIARSVEKRGGRRGSYLLVSAEKAQVATYASTHSVHTAIKHFSKEFGKDLKENTVRYWVRTTATTKAFGSRDWRRYISDRVAVQKTGQASPSEGVHRR